MQMVPYVVRQGDYLTRLAFQKGFDAHTVWNDPKNSALRELRGNMDILCPGDVVYIPRDRRPGLPLAVGSDNAYKATVPAVKVDLVLKRDGKPLTNEPYEVQGLPTPQKGTTDGDGRISIDVPVHLGTVRVYLTKLNRLYPLLVGHMDPATERSGARARLSNLGYLGHDRVNLDDAMRRALSAFQRDHQTDYGLEPTGELDTRTREALAAVHGS